MKTEKYFYALAAALMLCACAKNEEPQPAPEEPSGKASFTAFSEALTKTVVSDDYLSICWAKGDAVSIVAEGKNLRFTADKEGVSSPLSGENEVKKDTKSVWGIYPYSENYTFSNDASSVTVTVPAEQKFSAPGLADGANVSLAYLASAGEVNELDFCNLSSYILLDIPDSERIVECTLYAEPAAKLAGKVRVVMDKDGLPAVAEIVEGTESVTAGSEYPFDGKYLIPVLPQSDVATYHVDVKRVDGSVEKDWCRSDGEKLLRRNQKTALVKPAPEPVTDPEVSVTAAFWSDAALSMILPSGAESVKVLLNGSEVGSAAGESNSYRLTGLDCGTEYSVKLSVSVKGKTLESNEVTFTTGKIEQLTKNLSPTSVAVGIENRAGALSGNDKPCLHVQLFESEDVTGTPKYEAFVRDNEVQSEGHPFYKSLVVGPGTTYPPFNLAFGGLEAGKDYWFRVKSVASDTYTTYLNSSRGPQTMTSQNGNSEYSKAFKLTTASKHTAEDNEVLFEGFDDCFYSADFINCAVGLMPAFRAVVQGTSPNYNVNRNIWQAWEENNKPWSFHGLRTGLNMTHIAAFGFLNVASGKIDNKTIVPVECDGKAAAASRYWVLETGTTTIVAPKVIAGARIGSFRVQGTTGFESLVGDNRFVTADSYMGEGYAVLGQYYNTKDEHASSKKAAFVVKAVNKLSTTEKKSCTVSFRALAVQGRSGKITAIRLDRNSDHKAATTDLWETVTEIKIANSNGNVDENASEWSGLSETHKWYDYSFDIDLLAGDLIGFATDSESCICLDDIKIVLK